MAFAKRRTYTQRKRKKAKEGKERKRIMRNKGSTKSKKALFGDK